MRSSSRWNQTISIANQHKKNPNHVKELEQSSQTDKASKHLQVCAGTEVHKLSKPLGIIWQLTQTLSTENITDSAISVEANI